MLELNYSNRKLFTDPGTVIEVAKTVYEIYKFFKGDEQSDLDKAIEEIRTKLAKLEQLFEVIIDLLQKLEVEFKETVKDLVITRLSSEINAFSLNYEDFKNHPTNRQNIQEMVVRYVAIQGIAGQAFSYGYTHYDTIGFAFAVEFSLAKLLKKDSVTQENIIKNYRDNYFIHTINPDTPGSISNAKQLRANVMDNLTSTFYPSTTICGIWSKSSNPDGGRRGRLLFFRRELTVGGTIRDGFTFETKDFEIPNPNPTPPRDRHIVDDQVGSDALIAKYVKAHQDYLKANDEYIFLNSAVVSCSSYIQNLNNLL